MYSMHGSARRSDLMPPQRSEDKDRDERISAEHRRRRNPLRTPVHHQRTRHALEPAPPAYGPYGVLRDEVPEEGMEWDIDGRDGDHMEDFGIIPAQGARREDASQSCRHCEEEAYMEGIR